MTDKIEEVKKILAKYKKYPVDQYDQAEEAEEICQLFEPKPDEIDGAEETRKSLAEGHGITFKNAQEAIEWLKSGDRLLTDEQIFQIGLRTPCESGSPYWYQVGKKLIKAQLTLDLTHEQARAKSR